VFAKQYFPAADATASLLLAYSTFALSFAVRPLGGAMFAHLGDRLGRKRTLIMTLSLMGGGTVLIGMLPTYAQIGVFAPILLVLLRMVQGIGLGGEWGGAMLLAYENAPPTRRAFFASVPQMGIPAGMLLATLCMRAVSSLPDADFQRWGWRLPFLGSVVFIAVGLWMRSGIDETPAFAEARDGGRLQRQPLRVTLEHHWPAVVRATLAKMVDTGPFYIFTVFIISYATVQQHYERATVLNAIAISALLATLLMPVAGRLADRFGGRRVFLTGCLFTALASVPYFLLIEQQTAQSIILATAVLMVCAWPLATANLGLVTADMFPTEVRYSGITLGYQLGAALVGGTAPLLATWMVSADGGHWRWVAAYMIALAGASALGVVNQAAAGAARA
jgi:MFS family permease